MTKPDHFRSIDRNSCNNCEHVKGEWVYAKTKEDKDYSYICNLHKFTIRNGGHHNRYSDQGLDGLVCDDHVYDTEMR